MIHISRKVLQNKNSLQGVKRAQARKVNQSIASGALRKAKAQAAKDHAFLVARQVRHRLKVKNATVGLSENQAIAKFNAVRKKRDAYESAAHKSNDNFPEDFNMRLRKLMDRESFALGVLQEVLGKRKFDRWLRIPRDD